MKQAMVTSKETTAVNRQAAWRFIALMGVVSLFADMTYEGARSITGQFLATLGVGATAISLVAGVGEFIGYTFRLASGYLADRTGRYWTVTILGYGMNMVAVPMLALAGRWESAAALMFAERLGKGVRTPARDAMISQAAAQTGRGIGFGVHEALDQIGAVAGPLLVALTFHLTNSYQRSFAVLGLPGLLALGMLFSTWRLHPQPHRMENTLPAGQPSSLPRFFWFYLAFVGLSTAGFPHFQLLAYHLKVTATLPEGAIPISFGLAMGTDAIAAILIGRWFDRAGLSVLFVVPVVAALGPVLLFMNTSIAVWIGIGLWGVVMGAQESVMRAAVAEMTPAHRRGSAYGIFNAAYGLAWLAGAAVMGPLYDHQRIRGLVGFAVALQILAVPFLLTIVRSSVTRTRET